MAGNIRERNTKIPQEAIEGGAGENDKVEINGYTLQVDCEKTIQIPTKQNTKTIATEAKGRDVISVELGTNSMSIPVQSGGIETVRSKKNKKQEEQGQEI